jgi:diguanylate cyclase (GGDEF)-like protein
MPVAAPLAGWTGLDLEAVPRTEPGHALLAAMVNALMARQSLHLGIKSADDGRYRHVSAGLAALLGRPTEEVVGHTDAELFGAALATALRSADQTALARNEPLTSEHRFELRGERCDYTVLRVAMSAGDGRLLACLWQDNAPQRQRESQLRLALDQLEQEQKANEALRRELLDQGLRDQATGLYTRAHFDDQMRRELDLSTREHREFSLVYMAFDPFGPAVEAAGAAGRDRIYEAMGRLLRGNTRAMDASCRIDDSHFAVLLSGVGLATAHSRMEGLRRQCATQIVVLDGRELGFTVSMGVSSYPHTAHDQDAVIAACEAALAEARRRGGNNVALASIRFDPA